MLSLVLRHDESVPASPGQGRRPEAGARRLRASARVRRRRAVVATVAVVVVAVVVLAVLVFAAVEPEAAVLGAVLTEGVWAAGVWAAAAATIPVKQRAMAMYFMNR